MCRLLMEEAGEKACVKKWKEKTVKRIKRLRRECRDFLLIWIPWDCDDNQLCVTTCITSTAKKGYDVTDIHTTFNEGVAFGHNSLPRNHETSPALNVIQAIPQIM